jgi:hypothetical protein
MPIPAGPGPTQLPDWSNSLIENFKLNVFRVVADTLNYRRAADELYLITDCYAHLSYHLRRGCLLAVKIYSGF